MKAKGMIRLTRSIQKVDLKRQSAEDAFSRVQIFDGGPISFAEALTE